MTKTALICGISGQDGAWLAQLLLSKGYIVIGTSRDAQMSSFTNLKSLNIHNQIKTVSMSLVDFRSVIHVLSEIIPDEIYNLAGQSSVGLSFDQPVETLESHVIGTLNLLEAIRFLNKPTRFYNACSGECFGDLETGFPATELTAFRPKSPYAVAKAAAFWEVSNYRDSYNIFACSGILFNHESSLRPERFVTQKIISAACRIADGSDEKLTLGNIAIRRDWGWAPEYVDAMWSMLQQDSPEDFVIATGENHSLEEFVTSAFSYVGLDWRKYVQDDKSLYRPSETSSSYGLPAKALEKLNWKPMFFMNDVVHNMVDAYRASH
jgi:GDPmannose 4,6-dehydratase